MGTIKPQQILMPQKVHIGDTAELRCTFNSPSQKLQGITASGKVNFDTSVFQKPLDENEFEVLNITLIPAGPDYFQLSVTFIPWKTGVIKFPNILIEDTELIIDPEEIVSLTEQYKTTTLQDSASPLLLPGTTYKLYGAIIGLIIILLFIVILLIKHKSVGFFMKNKILQHKYRKNKKITIKKLLSIQADGQRGDGESAAEIQAVMRSYLEFRFAYPFTKTVTSQLMESFNSATQQLLSDDKYEAFGEIAGAFVRTDYIRYSKNGSFSHAERNQLINKIIENIEVLEGEDND